MVRSENGKTQINKGTIYRLPRPQELGLLFAALPERVMDAMFSKHPDTFKDFQNTILSLLLPSFVPDTVAPSIEQPRRTRIRRGSPSPHRSRRPAGRSTSGNRRRWPVRSSCPSSTRNIQQNSLPAAQTAADESRRLFTT